MKIILTGALAGVLAGEAALHCVAADPSAAWYSAARFVPRGDCGHWIEIFRLVYCYSNAFITAAYITIPLVLLYIEERFDAVAANPKVKTCFAAFIFLCGLGHLENLLAFVFPVYHIFAIWHAATAAVSWLTILVLVERYEAENGQRDRD